jgi:hypothetical protein
VLHTRGDQVIACLPYSDTLNTTGKQGGFVLGMAM